MRSPIVSAIVPVYNVAQYLDQCLDSLVNQTLSDIEIICVNDASTDNSLEILRTWEKKDERIKVIDSPENGRQGRARNLGIKAAVGEFLGFVDSDDYVSKECYKTLVDFSEKSDVVTVKSYTEFDMNRNIRIPQFKNSVDLSDQESIKRSIAAYGCRLWCSIFRRSYFVLNQFEFPEKIFYEDNAVVPLMFLCANHITVVDNGFPLYYYRNNPSSVVHGDFTDDRFLDRMVSQKMFLSNIRKYNMTDKYKEEFKFRFFSIYRNTIDLLLFRKEYFMADLIRQEYREYKKMVGDFPANKYMEDVKDFGIYKLIGKYPMLGDVYRLREKNMMYRYVIAILRRVCK